MDGIRKIHAFVDDWLELVSGSFVSAMRSLHARQAVCLIETQPGNFCLKNATCGETHTIVRSDLANIGEVAAALSADLKDAELTLVLHRSRFILKSLELPVRAGDFLDGIVRSQIDRLTPWTATDAVFGWTEPIAAGPDRISITVMATARNRISPVVDAMTAAGAKGVVVRAAVENSEAAISSVKVLEEKAHVQKHVAHMRRILALVLIIVGISTAGALATATVASVVLGARQDDLARTIAARRGALRVQRAAGDDPTSLARKALELRKNEVLPSVLVLEAVARVLPEHSYVTEFRIDNDTVRISGFSLNAPALIKLIEQAPEFSGATFFAPTTRGPSDPGERYHIQARIEPRVGPPS